MLLKIFTILWIIKICFCNENNNDDFHHNHQMTPNNNENELENKLIRDNLLTIKEIMNSNVNPCDNFFEYACGNYVKDKYDVGIFPNIADNRYIELAFDIDESMLFESARKAKQFYISCLGRGNTKDMMTKVNVLRTIKKWPIVNDDDNNDKTNWMRISEELKLLDLDPILEIGYDDFNMIEVFSGRDLYSPEYNPNDIEELNRTLIEFETSPEDALKVIESIVDYTRNRKQILETHNDCNGACENGEGWKLNLYYDVKAFKEEFSGIDWDDYFKIVFGRVLNDAEPIKLGRQKTTKPYIKLITRTDPKTITNYIIWTLIKGLQRLGSIGNGCGSKTFGQFESILTAIYSKVLFNENDRKRYLNILDRFENSFELIKHRYNVTHQRNLLYVLTKERRYINILDTVFSENELNNDFINVTIDSNNYYQNLINLGQQRECNLIERKCMDRLDLMMFIFEVSSMHDKPMYFSFSNKYYFLWESLIQHCFQRRRLNVTQYEEIKKCAYNQRADKSQLYSNTKDFDDKESEKSVIITTALQQTFEDFERWLQQNEEKLASKYIFDEFNLNSRKAFFLNFIQGYCNQKDSVKRTLYQSLMNLEEFSNVFECPEDSTMNLENKCKIW